MNRTRAIAVAMLAVGVAVWGACTARQQNGQECLKNADCQSERCIQYICVDPNASRPPAGDTGATPADAATDAAPDTAKADAPAESAAETSTPADTAGD